MAIRKMIVLIYSISEKETEKMLEYFYSIEKINQLVTIKIK